MNKLIKIIKIIFFKDVYAIGYRTNNDEGEFKIKADIPYQIIPPTEKEWYADPFLFEYDNDKYLFAEVMNYADGRGSIGVLKLNGDKQFKTVLKEPFHLSYPNVFKCKDNIYMIPETNSAKQLRLYKCNRFPYKWELEWIMLKDVKYVDTSVYLSNDTIYAETHDKLLNKNRFFKIDIEKRNIEEITNTDNKYINIRPGGNFIKTKSGIYHALQNCEEVYGEYLHIGKVDSFNNNGLSETEIMTYKVSDIKTTDKKHYERVHTFNKCKEIEVIDLLYTKLDLVHFFNKLQVSIKQKFFRKKQ